MTYTFGAQKARGDVGEAFLDQVFAAEYEIRPATRPEQRRGIDRIFVHRPTGRRLAVEYKTDYKAGWAYSSEADYLIHYIPGDELIYVIALEVLRRELPRWVREYPLRAAQNACACATGAGEGDATHAHGVRLVPLDEFEEHAEAVISI
jgi:hypothetical protein